MRLRRERQVKPNLPSGIKNRPHGTHRLKTTQSLKNNNIFRLTTLLQPRVRVRSPCDLILAPPWNNGTANAVYACSRFQFRYLVRFVTKSKPLQDFSKNIGVFSADFRPRFLRTSDPGTNDSETPFECGTSPGALRRSSEFAAGEAVRRRKEAAQRRSFHVGEAYFSCAKAATSRRSSSLKSRGCSSSERRLASCDNARVCHASHAR